MLHLVSCATAAESAEEEQTQLDNWSGGQFTVSGVSDEDRETGTGMDGPKIGITVSTTLRLTVVVCSMK